mgnify:CR=1 FL=1
MAKTPSEGKAGGAFMKPLQPSKELAAIVGNDPLPRSEVVSKVWDYIKSNSLQNPECLSCLYYSRHDRMCRCAILARMAMTSRCARI